MICGLCCRPTAYGLDLRNQLTEGSEFTFSNDEIVLGAVITMLQKGRMACWLGRQDAMQAAEPKAGHFGLWNPAVRCGLPLQDANHYYTILNDSAAIAHGTSPFLANDTASKRQGVQ
eukprot:754420-Hanusia_phi.AAC.3